MVDIRKALPIDSEEITRIVSLATETLRKTYRPVNSPKSQSKKPMGKLESLVAIENTKVVGVVEYMAEDDCIYFQGLAVNPMFRNRGIARNIIKALEGMARETGKRILKLATIEETGNMRLFEKIGFTVTSRKASKNFQANDCKEVHIITMEKNIA